MTQPHLPSPARAQSTRPRTQRERSNSLPIVEALGCSTPEARLLLAEGSAAIRRRRTRSQRNRPAQGEKITVFDPRDHLEFLNSVPPTQQSERPPTPPEARSLHTRIPSDVTDNSTSTLVPEASDDQSRPDPSAASPLGNYSANLAQFIKAQLRNIPTYSPGHNSTSPLSPRSCPDLSFRARTPPQSPDQATRRAVDPPQIIEIPHVRPPMLSQFSAWSSTDDDTDDDMPPLPDVGFHSRDTISNRDQYTSSVLGYYESSNGSSFFFSATPLEEDPQTAKGTSFPNRSIGSESPSEDGSPLHHDDSPSSSLSRPQLASSSAPSCTSTASTLSYFDCKRPLSLTAQMRDRIIAAVTPPAMHGKTFAATSPWEGAALTKIHDIVVDSQHRVHVDGMTFDMQRDFILPSGISTPC